MKYLIINYYWEPMVDAHAYRWPQLARELAAHGHDVEVVTSKIKTIKNEELSNGVAIKRIGILASKNKPELEVSVENSKKAKKKINNFGLKKLFINIYSRLYWPDPLWHWLPSLIVELYKRRNIKYDYVVSYYPCFAAHLGALIFRKLSRNRELKWVADYGDPFSVSIEWPPNNYHFYHEINKWIEGIIYSRSDTFAVMNEETKKRYRAQFWEDKKLILVPHLAPKIEPLKITPRAGTFVLRYVGSFHRKVRVHNLLFELAGILASSKQANYQIEIYGPTEYWEGIDIPRNIKILGKVPRDTALELLSSADVLININNSTELMTPSKIIEYIATRRPIINIGGSGLGGYRPLQRYAELGMCLNFFGAENKNISHIIETFIENSTGRPSVSNKELYSCLAGHTADEILKNYGMAN